MRLMFTLVAMVLAQALVAQVPDSQALPVELSEVPLPDAVTPAFALTSDGRGTAFLAWVSPAGSLSFSRREGASSTWTPVAHPKLGSFRFDPDKESALSLLWDNQTLTLRHQGSPHVRWLSRNLGETWEGPCAEVLPAGGQKHLYPDGTELILYRNDNPEGALDIMALRLWQGTWSEPQSVGREGWRPSERGFLPPSSVSLPPWAVVAWFTAADDEPRILLSSSPDAGRLWTSSRRVDLGRPRGNPDLVMADDGTTLVSWFEEEGADESQPAGLFLRRFSPGWGTLAPALLLRDSQEAPLRGQKLALVCQPSNQRGAELLQLVVIGGKRPLLRALRVVLPPPSRMAELDRACNCGASGRPGLSLRGVVLSVDHQAAQLRIAHEPIPGLLLRGEITAKAEPSVLGYLREGKEILGRLRREDGGWLVEDLRVWTEP